MAICPKLFIDAQGFRELYTTCFGDDSSGVDQTAEVKENLVELVSSSTVEKREEVILALAKKINQLISTNLTVKNYLLLNSQKVEKAKRFWEMFALSGASFAAVGALVVKRLRELQDDLGRCRVTDKASLLEFIKNPEGKSGFFKAGGASNLGIVFGEQVKELNYQEINIFSEHSLDKLPEEVASQVRNLRETLAEKAANNELIEYRIVLDQYNEKTTNAPARLVREEKDPYYPYKTTLSFKVYHFIKKHNEKISKTIVSLFAWTEVTDNALFRAPGIEQTVLLNATQEIVEDFNEFYKATEETNGPLWKAKLWNDK